MIKTTLKELQEVRKIIDKAIKETEELNLSERVYMFSMECLLRMRNQNDYFQAEARQYENKGGLKNE